MCGLHRYCIVAIILLSSAFTAKSQNPEKINSSDIIKKGVELYQKDKYKEAIAVYNKVPRSDTNYSIVLFNLALSHYSDSNYNESKKLAEQGLKLFPAKADDWYNLIANNYDNLGNQEQAIANYDKIINNYNNQYIAWYNKGITLFNQKKISESKKCFQQSILINPYYSPAHYYLGNVAYEEGNMVAAMLSYTTCLLVNPESKYSNSAIIMLTSISKVKDEVVKKATAYKGGNEDNFEMIQEIVLSKIALDREYKLKAELEDPIVRQLQVMLEKLSYNGQDKGFWNQYYVPYFEQVLKTDQFEPFVFFIFSNVNVPDIEKYVKRNKKKLEGFVPSFANYFNDIRATQKLSPTDRKNVIERIAYSNNIPWGKGKMVSEGTKSLLTGPWEFYYDNGQLKSKGLFSAKEDKDGEWSFYYDNGVLKEKSSFVNDKPEGHSQVWFDNGTLFSDGNFKGGELNGKKVSNYYNGLPKTIETFNAGKKDGNFKGFTSYGTLDYTAAYKDDKEEGPFNYYHKNGKLSRTATFKNGEPVGDFKNYYLDGTVSLEGKFENGKRAGSWKEYYNNGKVKSTYSYTDGELNGEYKEFYDNGELMLHSNYVNGKFEGKYEDFDFDGKVFSESVYEKGRLKELKFIDKTGKVISSSSTRNGAGNFAFYDPNGNKTSEGYFNKDGQRNGKTTFYFRNGKVRSVAEYKDGSLSGDRTIYFLNGTIAQKLKYKEDEENGYQVTYYENGNKKHEGEVINGLNEGLQIAYNELGQVTSKSTYRKGDLDGYVEYYHPTGKIDYEQRYTEGWVISMTQYDTTGKIVADFQFPKGSSAFTIPAFNGKNYIVSSYKNHYLNGEHKMLYPDGSTLQLQYYKNGIRDSVSRRYFFGGKQEYEGNFKMGEKDGKWSYYHNNGQLYYAETFNNGRLNGVTALYHDDGSLDREMSYAEGELNGEYKIYGDNKQLALLLNYHNGSLLSYTYEDKAGKLVPEIPVKNGTASVVGYYKNGTKSAEIDFEDDQVNGKRNIFYSTGKPYIESNRVLGYDNGIRKVYYSNGQVKKEENYYYDNLHGIVKKYWENGKLKAEENWYNGEKHGITKNFDNTGKLIQTLNYYFGSLETVK